MSRLGNWMKGNGRLPLTLLTVGLAVDVAGAMLTNGRHLDGTDLPSPKPSVSPEGTPTPIPQPKETATQPAPTESQPSSAKPTAEGKGKIYYYQDSGMRRGVIDVVNKRFAETGSQIHLGPLARR